MRYFIFLLFVSILHLNTKAQTPDKYLGWDGWENNYQTINKILLTKDGNSIITAGEEQKIRFWDIKTGSLKKTYNEFSATALCADISLDGSKLAVAGGGDRIFIWDINKDSLLFKIGDFKNRIINSVQFNSDGKKVACCTNPGAAFIWNVSDTQVVKSFPTGNTSSDFILFNKDYSKILITGNYVSENLVVPRKYGSLDLFDINSGFKLNNYGEGNGAMLFNPECNILLISNSNFILFKKLDYFYKDTLIYKLKTEQEITCFALTPNGKYLATGGKSGNIKVWDFNTYQLTKTITFDHGYPLSIQFSGDGTKLISGGYGYKNIRIYDLSILKAEDNNSIPENYSLSQNYPNPFNPETKIEYSIPEKSFVSIKIFNVMGKEIDILVNETQSAGNYSTTWKPKSISSGIYYYLLKTERNTFVRKALFLK